MKIKHVVYALFVLIFGTINQGNSATATLFEVHGLPIFLDPTSPHLWCDKACSEASGDYTGQYRGIPENTCTCQSRDIPVGGDFYVFGLPIFFSVNDVTKWCTDACQQKGGKYKNIYMAAPASKCLCQKQ